MDTLIFASVQKTAGVQLNRNNLLFSEIIAEYADPRHGRDPGRAAWIAILEALAPGTSPPGAVVGLEATRGGLEDTDAQTSRARRAAADRLRETGQADPRLLRVGHRSLAATTADLVHVLQRLHMALAATAVAATNPLAATHRLDAIFQLEADRLVVAFPASASRLAASRAAAMAAAIDGTARWTGSSAASLYARATELEAAII